ncbi:DJ-1/PfpI family protein [Paraflavitalea speifideaquila]|uniref:DJ-1/PfpI family protein n=1 Tax=Paraflavitalea speifideaquila TaxID=3076558 RepID=UPI0028E1E2A9|nr:DJ-1/PfpI family protein [Paraflavitalea speifideiaquila]
MLQQVNKETVQIVFVIPPQVHLLDITGPAHIFYEALSYGAPVQLYFTNVHTNQPSIESSSQLSLAGLVDFNTLTLHKGDLIFVPGLEANLLLDHHFLTVSSRPFQQWLIHQYQQEVTVCSVCTGSYLLAQAGLLNQKPCTTH